MQIVDFRTFGIEGGQVCIEGSTVFQPISYIISHMKKSGAMEGGASQNREYHLAQGACQTQKKAIAKCLRFKGGTAVDPWGDTLLTKSLSSRNRATSFVKGGSPENHLRLDLFQCEQQPGLVSELQHCMSIYLSLSTTSLILICVPFCSRSWRGQGFCSSIAVWIWMTSLLSSAKTTETLRGRLAKHSYPIPG